MRLIALAGFAALLTAAASAAPKTITVKKLDSVIESYNPLPVAVTNGHIKTLDGPTKFTCEAKDGCTIIEALTMQVGGSHDQDNGVAICVEVDGNPMNSGSCFNILIVLGTQGNYQAVSWRDDVHVKAGEHTLKTQVSSDFDFQIGWYQNDYSIYH